MGSTLQPGRRHSAKVEVSRDRTFDFMGEQARVFATPMLVHDIEVAEVKGRAVTFKVEGRDSVEPICRASGNRFVIDVASIEKRLTGKAAKAGLS
jgi:predicted thioesterase